jgi:hypothetical protein
MIDLGDGDILVTRHSRVARLVVQEPARGAQVTE